MVATSLNIKEPFNILPLTIFFNITRVTLWYYQIGFMYIIVLDRTERLLSDSRSFIRIKFNPKIRLIKR